MNAAHLYASRSSRRQLAVLAAAVSVVAGLAPVSRPRSAAAAATAGSINTTAGTGSFQSSGNGGPALAAGINLPSGLVSTAAGTDVSELGSNLVRQIDTAGIIHALAGGGTPHESPDGTVATRAVLTLPYFLAAGPGGDVYFDGQDDRAHVTKVDGTTGRLITVAGTGVPGYSGDGGPATQAQLNAISGLAVDGHGDVFIADSGNGRIREVDTTGTIRTVAGTGTVGYGGDGGPASAAQVSPRGGLSLDAAGDLFFSDDGAGYRVRRIDATSQIVTTVAGNGNAGSRGAGDGGPATSGSFSCIEGVNVDASGATIYVADACDGRIRQVRGGVITTVAGGGNEYLPEGVPATSAILEFPFQAVPDSAGNVLISELDSSRIRRVDHATGVLTTVAGTFGLNPTSNVLLGGFAGDGRPAIHAELALPTGLVLDASGDVIFGEEGSRRIREIDASGIISTLAGGSAGDGIPAGSASLSRPQTLTVDASGNLLIADCGDGQVRRVDSSGVISVFAGEGSGRKGIGDGGAATDAVLDCPTGLAVAPSGAQAARGTVYIADCVAERVRAVDPAGHISTVAGNGAEGYAGDHGPAVSASLACPSAVVSDSAGDVYIADRNNNRVRMVNARGVITTVAGDGIFGIGDDGVKATASHLATPAGLTLDGAGNLLISDGGRIRRLSAAAPGIITTVAGSGIPGFSGNGGPATNAQLAAPSQVLVSSGGDITVADTFNSVLRTISAGTPPPPPTTGCGAVVTSDIRLTADLGPCPGDGLVAGADGIVIDLNGHRILGGGTGINRAGIRLPGRHHVVVTGLAHPAAPDGQITGFEDGVAIIGGSNNTVQHVNIHDNAGGNAEFGDGIGIFASSGNTIVNNTLNDDGPYDGIGVLGQGSDGNLLQGNSVSNTTDAGFGGCDGTGEGVILTSFLDISWPRNVTVVNNHVVGNTITNNNTAGISDIGNVDELIEGNTITGNGVAVPCSGNGIGIQNTTLNHNGSHVTIRDNQVHGNGTNGIEVDTDNNTIVDNNAADNNVDNYGYNDLADYSSYSGTDCSHNVWSGNVWGAGGYYPDCTAAGGTGPNSPAAATAASPATATPHGHGPKRQGAPKR